MSRGERLRIGRIPPHDPLTRTISLQVKTCCRRTAPSLQEEADSRSDGKEELPETLISSIGRGAHGFFPVLPEMPGRRGLPYAGTGGIRALCDRGDTARRARSHTPLRPAMTRTGREARRTTAFVVLPMKSARSSRVQPSPCGLIRMSVTSSCSADAVISSGGYPT